MNFCFLGRRCYDKFSSTIANQIDEISKGNKFYFITDDSKESKIIRESVKDCIIIELPKYVKKYWRDGTVEELSRLEAKYSCEPIWKYIYSDRFLINRDYDYCIKTTVALFKMYEEVFSKYQIKYYYSETIATLQCYVAYLVGRKTGTHYIAQMTARGLDSTYHYVLEDPFQGITQESYDLADSLGKYSDEEIKRADTFLREFESKDIPPKNMVFTGKKPRLTIKDLLLPILRLVKSLDPELNDKYSYIYYKSYRTITDKLHFFFRYHRCKKYYNTADCEKKFVYYPLHYQPEASTIVCAQKYEKQLFFIDSWAKSLPADTILYVKEHYAILGHRPTSFYKSLRQYPNVVLIDPWESSRKLIEHSVAVTTLTGTAGWEALLLRKPVFFGGNIYFDNAPGSIKVVDIYDNYLAEIRKWVKPTREELIVYLCRYFRVIREGNVYAANTASLNHDNIKKVTDSLMEAIQLREDNI